MRMKETENEKKVIKMKRETNRFNFLTKISIAYKSKY